MRFGSCFSGIEAASAAWVPLGFECAYHAEIDPFPCALLKHHYPLVDNRGDINAYKSWPRADLDVLVGGSPCQSFSIAGLRKGLDDPRGNLMLVYLALVERERPEWVVWENVPGVLSSDGGRSFGALLGGLAQLGYGFAYRILDAQYFGVAQRRRRVFVVANARSWRRAAAVLFERQSLRGDPAPGRQAGEGIANSLVERPDCGGGNSEGQRLITHALSAEGFDASEDGTGRGTPLTVAPTLDAQMDRKWGSNQWVDNGFAVLSSGQANAELAFDQSPALTCLHEAPIAFGFAQITHPENRANPQPGDPAPALSEAAPLLVDVADPITASFAKHHGASGGKDSQPRNHIPAGNSVRRLTPRECERLQGFPDDYTAITYRKKPAADGPRYKALGNSMAVPVMGWIGQRILDVAGL